MVFIGPFHYNDRQGKEDFMPDLRSALIQMTIKEGAANPSNKRFSTKTIAENCGVSEFTVFTLFKTKESLVDEALGVVREDSVSSAQKAARASRDVPSLVKTLLYHAFEVPEYTIFLANYGFWTGKVETDESKRKAEFAQVVDDAKKSFVFLQEYSPEEIYLLWNYVWRQINYAIEEVYDGLAQDSREYREYYAQLIANGLYGFKEEAR